MSLQKQLRKLLVMTEPIQWKVTRLPCRGPKSGQSQESFLRGKAQGDKQWDKQRERNFQKLLYVKATTELHGANTIRQEDYDRG